VSQFKFGKLDVARFGLSSAKGSKAKRIMACKYGMKLIGAKYSHSNSTNKAVGLDCTQLIWKCYNRAGIPYYNKRPVTKSNLRAGDVVYYRGLYGGYHGHVGMYIGNGYVLQSTTDQGVYYPRAGVRITKLTFRSSPQGYASPRI
jgi:peptidoglycan endopeptidase LytE